MNRMNLLTLPRDDLRATVTEGLHGLFVLRQRHRNRLVGKGTLDEPSVAERM